MGPVTGAAIGPIAGRGVERRSETAEPGGRAPGLQARDAVAEARAGGADLPANARGVAASAIAKGADAASVFLALLPSGGTGPDEGSGEGGEIADPVPPIADPIAEGPAMTVDPEAISDTGPDDTA